MTRKFDLDDEVWWFECDSRNGLSLRNGKINGIRWGKGYMRRRRLIWVEFDEVDIDLLHHTKEEAVSAMIGCLQVYLD